MNQKKPVSESSQKFLSIISAIVILAGLVLFVYADNILADARSKDANPLVTSLTTSTPQSIATSTSASHPDGWQRYNGKIYHIFFHSLVLDPDLAFNDPARGKSYEDYMVTRPQFKNILDELYNNQYVLIDISSIYNVNADGSVSKKDLYLPPGKKPLIVSLDDLNYYSYMKGHGFADKLVLDSNGDVATEVPMPDGSESVTRDGDVVPILDDFVAAHPDFSIDGARGVIAETGFAGVLGYRTQSSNTVDRERQIEEVKPVIARLKETGWKFASHSYTHENSYLNDTITSQELDRDMQKWQDEVEPLVGPTDIFVGPFGQVFKPNDPRRQILLDHGFKMLCGVGMDLYLHYFPDYVMMDRADIDGIRLNSTSKSVSEYFDVKKVLQQTI